jgi:hypothetical protein
VVHMAVSRVDRVADRLDGVAESGGNGLREALTGKPAPTRSDRKDAKKTGTAVRARQAPRSASSSPAPLKFLQRRALKLLKALRRLARRSRTAPPEPKGAGADEDRPEQDAAGRDSEPSERRGSRRIAGVPARSAAMRRTRGPGVRFPPSPRRGAADPRHLQPSWAAVSSAAVRLPTRDPRTAGPGRWTASGEGRTRPDRAGGRP